MSGATLGLREHQFEKILSGLHEPASAVEGGRPAIAARHDHLEREGALGDGEPLRVLEQLAPDALGLVLGADEELVDPDDIARSRSRAT